MITEIALHSCNHTCALDLADLRSSHSSPHFTVTEICFNTTKLLPQSVATQRLFLTANAETKQPQAHINTHVHTHTHTFSVLDLGELSVCVLCFLSISLMRRRLFCLSVCDFSGKDGWKKLDIDVRPTFHLEAGYPLSKHRTLLTNESDRKTGSEE